jgi:hypothetical protein
LAFILHSQLFSLEFVSNICALGLAIVGLAFLSNMLYGDYMVVKMIFGQAVQNCTACTAAVNFKCSLVSITCAVEHGNNLTLHKSLNLFCPKTYIHKPSQPATKAPVEVPPDLKNLIN